MIERTTPDEIIATLDIDKLDDRAILRGLLEMQRDAANYLLDAATRDLNPNYAYSIDADTPLTQYDYSGDHDDYNPAAAHLLATITDALCSHIYESIPAMMLSLFNDDTFIDDLMTSDLATPSYLTIDYID